MYTFLWTSKCFFFKSVPHTSHFVLHASWRGSLKIRDCSLWGIKPLENLEKWITTRERISSNIILHILIVHERPANVYQDANTRHILIYADDSAIVAQNDCFEDVEAQLLNTLKNLGEYFRNNHRRPIPIKTRVPMRFTAKK